MALKYEIVQGPSIIVKYKCIVRINRYVDYIFYAKIELH